jgi:hypothetical protein
MYRLPVAFLLISILVSIQLAHSVATVHAGDADLGRASQQQRTQMMQQSDYYRRAERERQARAQEKQMAAVTAAEEAASPMDYVAFIMLLVSVVALIFLSKRGSRARSNW